MLKQVYLFLIIIYLVSSLGCIYSGKTLPDQPVLQFSDGPTITLGDYFFGRKVYWADAIPGDFFTLNISGWPATDGTVMQTVISADVRTQLTKVASSSSNSNKIVIYDKYENIYYFGYKARQMSMMVDIYPATAAGSFNLDVRTTGWVNVTDDTCILVCDLTLYSLSYYGTRIPTQYNCYGNLLKFFKGYQLFFLIVIILAFFI